MIPLATRVNFSKSGTTRGLIGYSHNATANSEAITFGTAGGTERMRINATGVGIGTSSPSYDLDVDSTIHIGNDGGSGFTHSRLILDANGATRLAGIFSHNQVNDTEWFFGNPYDTPDSFAINRKSTTTHSDSTADTANSLVTVNSSGQVGIGGSPSGQKFEVIEDSGDATMRLRVTDGASDQSFFFYGNYTGPDQNIYFGDSTNTATLE